MQIVTLFIPDRLIIDHLSIYKLLNSPNVKILKNYDFQSGKIIEYKSNLTGYYYLLKNNIGQIPHLNNSFKESIESAIKKTYPNFHSNSPSSSLLYSFYQPFLFFFTLYKKMMDIFLS